MPRIYAIAGGKGGIGKSFITANLGVQMTRRGNSVLLIDLDLGGANLHTFLGCPPSTCGINLFLDKTIGDLSRTAITTAIPNLALISSMNCSAEIANIHVAQKLKLIKAIRHLPHDHILIDLGSGTHFNTMDFFLGADEGIMVFTPETTTIENNLRFIYSVYWRKLKQLLTPKKIDAIKAKLHPGSGNTVIKASKILEVIGTYAPDEASRASRLIRHLTFNILMNRQKKYADGLLAHKIAAVCRRHFNCRFQSLGNIRYSSRVEDAIRRDVVYTTAFPHTLTSRALDEATDKLLG